MKTLQELHSFASQNMLLVMKNCAKWSHAFESQKRVENYVKIVPKSIPKGQCGGPRAKKEPRQGGLGAEVEPTVKPRRQ